MAYQAGTASSSTNLLTILEAFAAANGWTTDSFVNDGTGKRLHIHKNGCYANFRSFISESYSGTRVNDVGLYAGSGYSGASAWDAQAGRPIISGSDPIAWIDSLTSGTMQYYLYAYSDTGYDVIYCVIQGTSGVWSHFMIGNIQKLDGWTGGKFYTAMHRGNILSNNQAIDDLIGVRQSGWENPPGFLEVSGVDSFTGWMSADGGGSVPRIIGEAFFTRSLYFNNPQTWNSRPIPFPYVVYGAVGATWGSSTAFRPLALLPKVYWLNIKSIVPGTLLTIQADNYRCFPFWKKDVAGVYGASFSTNTAMNGFAIKEE